MINQLPLQNTSGLYEQATVNGFVGHAHAPIVGELHLEPTRDLFGRPIPLELARYDSLQPAMASQQTWLRSSSMILCSRFCLSCPVLDWTAMARDFPANG